MSASMHGADGALGVSLFCRMHATLVQQQIHSRRISTCLHTRWQRSWPSRLWVLASMLGASGACQVKSDLQIACLSRASAIHTIGSLSYGCMVMQTAGPRECFMLAGRH